MFCQVRSPLNIVDPAGFATLERDHWTGSMATNLGRQEATKPYLVPSLPRIGYPLVTHRSSRKIGKSTCQSRRTKNLPTRRPPDINLAKNSWKARGFIGPFQKVYAISKAIQAPVFGSFLLWTSTTKGRPCRPSRLPSHLQKGLRPMHLRPKKGQCSIPPSTNSWPEGRTHRSLVTGRTISSFGFVPPKVSKAASYITSACSSASPFSALWPPASSPEFGFTNTATRRRR